MIVKPDHFKFSRSRNVNVDHPKWLPSVSNHWYYLERLSDSYFMSRKLVSVVYTYFTTFRRTSVDCLAFPRTFLLQLGQSQWLIIVVFDFYKELLHVLEGRNVSKQIIKIIGTCVNLFYVSKKRFFNPETG